MILRLTQQMIRLEPRLKLRDIKVWQVGTWARWLVAIALSCSLVWLPIAPVSAQTTPVLFKQTKNNDPPQRMTEAERADLKDPFFQLVLKDHADATSLTTINQFLKSKQQNLFVVDERIKDAEQKPNNNPARRRAILTPTEPGFDSQNVLFSVSFTPEQFPIANFIEVMGWDDAQSRFNYYKFDQSGGETVPSWKFRGSSQDADLLSVEARKGTCLQCHINGASVMKELIPPWNHWHSADDRIDYLDLNSLSNKSWPIIKGATSPFKTLTGAESLEFGSIEPTIARFNERRIKALKSPDGQSIVDARRLLKPLFVTTEFNLSSSFAKSPLHPFGQPPTSPDTIQVPSTFFANTNVLSNLSIFPGFSGFASLSSQDYVHLVRQTKTSLGGKQPGDTNFAWFIPEPSFIDTNWVEQLLNQNIIPLNFVAAAMAVDLETPILSSDRAKLWNEKIIPAQFKIGAQNDLIAQVIKNLERLNPAQGTPEATFLQMLRDPKAVDTLKQRVEQYVSREQRRLDLTGGATPQSRSDEWIRLYKLSLQRKEAILADATLKSLDERGGALLFSRGDVNAAVTPLPSSVTPPKPRPTLRRGAKGNDVIFLQQRLKAVGVFSGTIDGDFGPMTEAAVIAFQKRSNLTPDGVVGSLTWAALEPKP